MAITRTQIARQLYRFGGDTMGGPNDRSASGPGPDDRSTAEQTMNTRKAIRDAQKSNSSNVNNITDTVGDAMLFKNLINLNPMGVMKNVGSKMILDKLMSNVDTEEDDSPMQVAELTPKQQKFIDQKKFGLQENLLDAKDVFETINNPDLGVFDKGVFGVGGQEPTTPKEFNDYLKSIGVVQQVKDGGRIGAMGGGIMGGLADGNFDFENARQMYGLGKLVKKVTRSVKKIAKSPVGKAALLYAGTAGLGALGAGKLGTGFKFFGPQSFLAPSNVMSNLGVFGTKLFANPTIAQMKTKGLEKGFFPSLLDKIPGGGATAAITGTSALAGLLTPEQEEEAEQIADETGFSIEEARNSILARAQGNIRDDFRARGFRAEGGPAEGKEPVAKKTMPLLDMGGQEMDLRAEGGFVPIGRMEKADDVPARLSKNEFVFTADAVRNAGDGNVDKGAEVMYNMMKNLESGGDVSEESQGLKGARKMFQTSQRLEEVL